MIPQIIHYCWLSDDPIPEDYRRCMTTWKAKLPDWEFMLWDTKRFDVNSVLWVKQAFEVELYAVASDYIRLYAVYNNGGIYLDMDMEVVKPFDSLLQADLMLAYENHISRNVEAGCFGAVKEHPYIKKCMAYIESMLLFEPNLLAKILDLPRSERHEFINPLIMPEIMKNTAEEFFSKDKFHFLSCDYFTAKNVVTGKIEKTENTFTIHHFATQYHSEKWRNIRQNEQKIRHVLGEKSIFSLITVKLYGMIRRIYETGFLNAMKYYYGKYIAGENKK
ncbi:MAG: glycosyl transferase [Spirochaetaceae bacterium]|jgi:mannosyltransferase OCH1-like enzyme|nr:glycosyl transferase [Spirochaetaceae bacterium]